MRIILSVFLPFIVGIIYPQTSVLEDYVNNVDPLTNYSLITSDESGFGYTTYILKLISQKWLSNAEVNNPVWKHWLIVTVPMEISHETAFLLIDGGSNSPNPPDPNDEAFLPLGILALQSKSVMGILQNVPNEPLNFSDEDFTRTEDAIIAYSWDKFLSTEDPKWPVNIAMVKSAVTAMDAIQDFCADITPSPIMINDFVVSGGSKRGWTTWLTAAVDDRVRAAIPVVFDALNILKSFRFHYGSYGEWSPAVNDYEEIGIFDWFTEPIIQDLMQIVDPFIYRDNLTMPKYIIAATGDEFFVPSTQNYMPYILGDNHLAYFTNTGHGFSGQETNALQNLYIFYQSILDEKDFPDYSWQRLEDGSIVVECQTVPTVVKVWQATNTIARDFRDYVVPDDAWESTELNDQGGGVYIAQAVLPDEGWTGMLVEMQFDLGYDYPFMVTTDVSIFPDDLPFAENVTLAVTDTTQSFSKFQAVGSLTLWNTMPFLNNGNGNDDSWTAVIPAVSDGEYIWELYGIDCCGNSLPINGTDGLSVTVFGDNITGSLSYTITDAHQGDCALEVDQCGVCGGDNGCLSINDLILPNEYSISNIYPNPFNPITRITYGLPEKRNINLIVYNIRGRQIETLVNNFQTAGYHTIKWNASSYSSGVYLIRMESGEFTQTQKVALLK